MKEQLEQHIKQSLERYEAEYNPADWSDMQKRLSKAKARRSNTSGKILLIAASLAAVAGSIYYFSAAPSENNIAPVKPANEKQDVVVNEVPVKQTESKNAQPEAKVKNQSSVNSEAKRIAKDNTDGNKSAVNNNPVQPAANNVVENKASVQEQPKHQEDVPAVVPSQLQVQVLTADFHMDAGKVCQGSEVHFTADNTEPSCTYKWYFGDGTSSAEQNPAHAFAEAKSYTVRLIVTGADKKRDEQKNTIIVSALPSVRIESSVSEDNNMLVNFEASGDKAVEWKWSFGDKQTSSSQNPSHTYTKRGIYLVELTAKNSAGCVVPVKGQVDLRLNLNAPNGFAPNSDRNTWMPDALRSGDYIFTLTIFDKTNKQVFKTSDKNDPWKGAGAQAGDTFRWVAVVKDKNGDETQCQGLITIAE